jgi:hypothetical protein
MARRLGRSTEALDTLLATLFQSGLLRDGQLLPTGLPARARASLLPEARALALRADPSNTLRQRWDSSVSITGNDRIAVPIAAALAAAGVGQVTTQLTGLTSSLV